METIIIALIAFIIGIIAIPIVLFAWIYIKDEKQQEHSILRNYPVIGRFRYILEKIGPELRQYIYTAMTMRSSLFHERNMSKPSSPANTKAE